MSFHVEFFVAGLAKAQPRAQRGKGGHVIMAKADDPIHKWREGVRYEGQRAMAGRVPYLDPIRMDVCFLMPRPQDKLKEKWQPDTHELPHAKDPDTDNLLKAAMDALKMVTWGDDCQVSYIIARKRYVTGPEAPGMYMRLTPDLSVPWTGRLWSRILSMVGVKTDAPT